MLYFTHMAGPSFVDVKDVSVVYKRSGNFFERLVGKPPQTHAALRHISFQLSPGDQVTLYGHAGAGKTTLLHVLAGGLQPTSGRVVVNGTRHLRNNPHAAAGYISSEEPERHPDTVHDVLYTFGQTHAIPHLEERVSHVLANTGLTAIAHRPSEGLSKTERLRLNIARAALSEAPLVLFDDVADELGAEVFADLLARIFSKRTVIVATRTAATAEALQLPLLLLHNSALAHYGTRDDIAGALGIRRTVDAWVEGVRYDMLRRLKNHPGVVSVQLLPNSRFAGQHLRIMLHSARYFPALYDTLSQAELIEVTEVPPTLQEIVEKL